MHLTIDLLKAAAVWCLVVILISAISASFAVTWLQGDFADLRIVFNQEHAEVQRQLGTKVDTETRRAMLADLEHRLDRIERHLQLLDTRVNVIMEDRREGMSRGQRD